MKDVRPKVKKLLENLPVPKWDPKRIFVNFPRGEAPDIPFCHYNTLKTIFFKGAKFEILQFRSSDYGEIKCILRITIDGIMYHVSTCPQWGEELLYEIFFCKCNDLPVEVELHYMVKNPHEPFNFNVTNKVEIHYEYRSDHQDYLETKDSDVVEFFQNMINLCREFYLANRSELDRML